MDVAILHLITGTHNNLMSIRLQNMRRELYFHRVIVIPIECL